MLTNAELLPRRMVNPIVYLFVLSVMLAHVSVQALASEYRYYIPVNEWEPIDALPKEWRGADWKRWKFYKRLDVADNASIARHSEPVDVEVEFHSHQVTDLAREICVAAVQSQGGPIKEVPSQVYHESAEDQAFRCRLVFLADLKPNQRKTYLIFFGNPDCARPSYETDL